MVGCAPAPPAWPARIQSLNNFSEQDEARVWEAVDKLNELSALPVIEDDGYYPIEIYMGPPNPEHRTRVGYAVRRYSGCRVELSSEMFEQKRYDLIVAVALHEFGVNVGQCPLGEVNARLL